LQNEKGTNITHYGKIFLLVRRIGQRCGAT
jgi:hypothetical protein